MWIKRDGQKDRPLPPFSPSPWPKRPWEGRRKEAGGWRAGLRRALQSSMPEELVFVSSCEEKGKTLFAVPEQLPVATREDFRNADRNSPNSSVEFLTRITLWLKIVLNGWNLVCDSSPLLPLCGFAAQEGGREMENSLPNVMLLSFAIYGDYQLLYLELTGRRFRRDSPLQPDNYPGKTYTVGHYSSGSQGAPPLIIPLPATFGPRGAR